MLTASFGDMAWTLVCCVGERDDGDVGDAIVPAGYCEADAVDRDGAFFGYVAAEIFGDADGEPPIVAFGD